MPINNSSSINNLPFWSIREDLCPLSEVVKSSKSIIWLKELIQSPESKLNQHKELGIIFQSHLKVDPSPSILFDVVKSLEHRVNQANQVVTNQVIIQLEPKRLESVAPLCV